MLLLSRRQAIGTLGLCTLGGCAGLNFGNAVPKAQQVVADVDLAISDLLAMAPQLPTIDPSISASLVSTITSDLTAAETEIRQLGTDLTSPTSLGVLQAVEKDFNAALAILAGVPLPMPWGGVVAAAVVVAPELEAFLNSKLGVNEKRALVRKQEMAPTMSIAKARGILASFKAKGYRR